jgi:hypothetical protein
MLRRFRFNNFNWAIVMLLLLMSTDMCIAQTESSESGRIKFVCQWPSTTLLHPKKSFSRRMKDVLLGSKIHKIIRPVSMVVDHNGEYWILDQESRAVYLASADEYDFPKFIEKKSIDLASLVGITNFKGNNLLITDSYLNKIFLIDPKKKHFYALNDTLNLDRPTGIAYSPVTHEIWICETGRHRLIALNEEGVIVKTIGKRGNQSGEFNFPTNVSIDKAGNIYVVDAMNFRIQIFNKNGELQKEFGSNGDATGTFASPKGIAIDSYGHIYVADALFHAIQIFDFNGNFLYSFGSQGHDENQFWMPSGIFIDAKDHIYIADSYNSRIQEFQLIMGEK